jgi:hypothetical protein
MVKGVLRKVAMQALQGNLTAARIFFERTLGRAADAPAESEPFESLPALRTAASCTAAIDKIAAAITSATIDAAAAKLLLDVVQARMKSIELNEYEVRLAELEKQVATVDMGGGGGRR